MNIPTRKCGLVIAAVVTGIFVSCSSYAQAPFTLYIQGGWFVSQFGISNAGPLTDRNTGMVGTTPTPFSFGMQETDAYGVQPGETIQFDSPIRFGFVVSAGNYPLSVMPVAPFNAFQVDGLLEGSIGLRADDTWFSNAQIHFTTVRNLATGEEQGIAATRLDPSNGQTALMLSATIGAQPYLIYLDSALPVPIPGASPTSITGYITTGTPAATPEPGPVGLFLGIAAFSTGFFLKRRGERKKETRY